MNINMNLFMMLYVAALFVALTPGVLLTLPKGGARLTVAVVHGLVFALVYHFTYKMVWRTSISGFQNMPSPNMPPMPEMTNMAQKKQ